MDARLGVLVADGAATHFRQRVSTHCAIMVGHVAGYPGSRRQRRRVGRPVMDNSAAGSDTPTSGDLDRLVGAARDSGIGFGIRDAVVRFERPSGIDSQIYRGGRLVAWDAGEVSSMRCPTVTLKTDLPGVRLPCPSPGAESWSEAAAWRFGWERGETSPCPPLGRPMVGGHGDRETWPGATANVAIVVHGTPFGSVSVKWEVVDGLVREVHPLVSSGADVVLELPLAAVVANAGKSAILGFGHPGCVVRGPPDLVMMVGGLFDLSAEGCDRAPTDHLPAVALVAELAGDGGLAWLDAVARRNRAVAT